MTTQRTSMPARRRSLGPSVRGLMPLLRLPDLRRLVIVRLLSALGDGAFQGALAGVVLFSPERQTGPEAIAATFAVLLLPYSVIGPFAGALLDRWSRRQVLVWANVVRCALVAMTAALIALHAPQPVLFGVALLVTGASRFVGSGISASMPHTVAIDSLTAANSLATTVGSIATVVGGGLAIAERSLLGQTDGPMSIVISTVVLFYLFAALVARHFSVQRLGPDETDEPAQTVLAVLQGFTGGFKHVLQRPTVGLAIALIGLVRFCFGIATLMVLLLFRHQFAGGDGKISSGMNGIAAVLGVSAVGLFLGALTTSLILRHIARTTYLVLVLAFSAVVVLVCGSQFTVIMTLVTAGVLGFTYQSAKVCVDTIVQADSDDAHVGRVFALYDTVNNLLYVGAFVLGIALVPADGAGLGAVVLVAAVYLLTGAGYFIGIRRLSRRSGPVPTSIEHDAHNLTPAPDPAC